MYRIVLFVAMSGVVTGTLPASSQNSAARRVERLDMELGFDALTSSFEADGELNPRIYVMEESLQIVLDLLNVRNEAKVPEFPEQNGMLARVVSQELPMHAYDPEAAREDTFARFIFELKQPVWHSLSLRPGYLELGLQAKSAARDGSSGSKITPAASRAEQTPELALSTEGTESGPVGPAPTVDSVSGASFGGGMELPDGVRIEPADVDPDFFFSASVDGAEQYRIGPEDLIEVRVFETEQLNRTVRVEPDGTILLPLVGAVRLAGLTAPEAADEVAGKLRGEFVADPQVTILIKEFHSRRVSLLGAVAKAGVYPLIGERDLLELLAESGGLSEGAGSVLYLFRRLPDGRNARLTVPLNDLLVRGDPRWNVRLEPGDVVSVPPDAAISVSVVGAVTSPGVYKLPASEGATVLRVIALAGGLKERASKSIRIKRRSAGRGEVLFEVDLDEILSGKKSDLVLEEGDVVVVKQSFF